MTEPTAKSLADGGVGELLDLTIGVNGVARHAKAPAPRLRSDCLSHDRTWPGALPCANVPRGVFSTD